MEDTKCDATTSRLSDDVKISLHWGSCQWML